VLSPSIATDVNNFKPNLVVSKLGINAAIEAAHKYLSTTVQYKKPGYLGITLKTYHVGTTDAATSLSTLPPALSSQWMVGRR
jgi:hypothetical protein